MVVFGNQELFRTAKMTVEMVRCFLTCIFFISVVVVALCLLFGNSACVYIIFEMSVIIFGYSEFLLCYFGFLSSVIRWFYFNFGIKRR